MALVEVARFLDLTEAQAAAAALRASGISVHMANENWGQIETHLQLAVGGFPLLAFEEDAEDARAFVEAHRTPPAPATETYPVVTLGAVLVATLAGGLGWGLALLRRRRALPDEG